MNAEFVTGLNIKLPDGCYCATHAHSVLEVVYHLSGAGVTIVGAYGALEFAEGSVVVYPPGIPHDQRVVGSGEDCCVLIDFPDGVPPEFSACGYVPAVGDPMIRSDLVHLSRSALPDSELLRYSCHCRVRALVSWLMATVTGALSVGQLVQGAVEQAYHFLETEYYRPLRMKEVADEVGISESYLRHQFKVRYNASLVECLTDIRIARACDLLRHTELPLKMIAQLTGFDNERYFSKMFRRYQGCPPGAYRRSAVNDRASGQDK